MHGERKFDNLSEKRFYSQKNAGLRVVPSSGSQSFFGSDDGQRAAFSNAVQKTNAIEVVVRGKTGEARASEGEEKHNNEFRPINFNSKRKNDQVKVFEKHNPIV